MTTITVTDTLTGRELPVTDVESALAEQQAAFPAGTRGGWVPQPTYWYRARQRNAYGRARAGLDHLHHEAADWRDLAFAAEQAQTEPGPQARDVTGPLLAAYRAQVHALTHGLPTAAPLPEQHPARELAPANLDADAERRRRALAAAAQREPAPADVALDSPPLTGAELVATRERVKAAFKRVVGEPERPSWRDYGGIIAGAALGLVAFGALLIGRVVL